MSKFDPYEFLTITRSPEDGTLTRNMPTHETEPDSEDEAAALPGYPVVSKDVTVSKDKGVWVRVRVYMPTKIPSNDGTVARLPVIVYFHDGSFVQFTAQDPVSHSFCKSIATMLTAIVVSVSYRLAPENRLPTQYEDAVDERFGGSVSRPSCRTFNPSRGFTTTAISLDLSSILQQSYSTAMLIGATCTGWGMGAGGNVAFFAAMRIMENSLAPMKIDGLILSQPLFGGSHRTKSEMRFAMDPFLPLPVNDLVWELALPKGMTETTGTVTPWLRAPTRTGSSSSPVPCARVRDGPAAGPAAGLCDHGRHGRGPGGNVVRRAGVPQVQLCQHPVGQCPHGGG
ncbi:hypothetical protein SAY87_014577 [Trapa incisa]|uniref:Alpha/beta hydrolase fold-3 domain-containing protein n=1 Tax=Trapa incisa TaxID=236973 RepID=A0AAN7GNU5_9MYRT|nr:hypothetical protein SAY87_014577 [Trapa incisa]